MTVVLDASMTVAWFLPEEQGDAVSNFLLQRVGRDGAIVPALWRIEVASAFRKALRRGRCVEADVTASLRVLEHLPITLDLETHEHAWGTTRELSQQYNLSVYDAAYLELALRRERPLASREGALLAAAKKAGVEALRE